MVYIRNTSFMHLASFGRLNVLYVGKVVKIGTICSSPAPFQNKFGVIYATSAIFRGTQGPGSRILIGCVRVLRVSPFGVLFSK